MSDDYVLHRKCYRVLWFVIACVSLLPVSELCMTRWTPGGPNTISQQEKVFMNIYHPVSLPGGPSTHVLQTFTVTLPSLYPMALLMSLQGTYYFLKLQLFLILPLHRTGLVSGTFIGPIHSHGKKTWEEGSVKWLITFLYQHTIAATVPGLWWI